MRPMILGTTENDALNRIRAYAEAHPIPLERLKAMVEEGASPGDNPERVCFIPFGFRVVFTIENQPNGWSRHLSISCRDAPSGKLPNSAAMQLIGRALGMRMNIFDPTTSTYFEYRDPVERVRPYAVSIVEPMEPS